MSINTQAPAPRLGGFGMDVHSVFYTIQGEGPYAGRPAVFVRLYGCNLQCPLCDTDYTSEKITWPPQHHQELAAYIIDHFEAPTAPLVVITGGEPLRQAGIVRLVVALQKKGCLVQIETNGTLAFPDAHDPYTDIDWDRLMIVCSPKTGRVHNKLKPLVLAYKYVLSANSVDTTDGLPKTALDHPAGPILARPHEGFPRNFVYLQPCDPDPQGENLQACIRSCYEFGYTLCIQQHKIIGVP